MRITLSARLLLLNVAVIAVLVTSVVVVLAMGRAFDVLLWAYEHARWAGTGILALALFALLAMPLVTLVFAAIDLGSGSRTQALVSAGVSGALMLFPFVWVLVGWRLAAREEDRARQAWASALEPIEVFTDRYPTTENSAGALAANAAARLIGVEMIRRADDDQWESSPARKAYQAVRKELLVFVSAQAQQPDETPDAPPSNIAGWLSAHHTGVVALVRQILEAGPIVLETDWSVDDPPIPSLYGLRDVQSILLLDALEDARAGNAAGAVDSLDAAWRIGAAVRDRGEMISQLMVVAFDRTALGVLRKIPRVPETWRARLAALHYGPSFLRTLEGEAWRWSRSTHRITALRREGRPARGAFWTALEGPYLRLMAANYSRVLAESVASLRQVDPCSLDMAVSEESRESPIPKWNFFGRMSWPPVQRGALDGASMALDIELTEKVLAARALRAGQRAWPAQLPDLQSNACPGANWIYSTSEDGSVSLTFSRKLTIVKPPAFRAQAMPAARAGSAEHSGRKGTGQKAEGRP